MMSTRRKITIFLLVALLIAIGVFVWLAQGDRAELTVLQVSGTKPEITQPDDEIVPTVNVADPIGWQADETPTPAKGLVVTRFAQGLDHPRIMHTLPNGDVLVTLTNSPPRADNSLKGIIARLLFNKAGAGDPSPNKLVLLRDSNGDGRADIVRTVRTADLDSPSGIEWRDGTLYIANHNAVLAFPYRLGDPQVSGPPKKLMDLPGGGNHWMRNLKLSPDGSKLYIAVGSATNIANKGMDAEKGRAMIWELDLASGRQREYAVGLRNPNGLDYNPMSGELWTTVNERDLLGSDLVPDYLTNVPVGAQYGWPWIYWGDHLDQRVDAPIPAYLSDYARRPEYAMGPHVAALGLAFSQGGNRLGPQLGRGAFIARHGSWNRVPASGYDVVFVPFDARGNPTGKPEAVLSGFLAGNGKTHGRPTWVAFAKDGALLVTDDTAGIVWRVIAPGAAANPAPQRYEGKRLPPRVELNGDPSAAFSEDFAREQPQGGIR